MPDSHAHARLTFAEIAVLKHTANGLTGKAIAELLDITQGEVARMIRSVCKKTGCRNRVHLARYAWSNNYAPLPRPIPPDYM
jgi:DNA-binding NarL/FixJ family response regulator